MPRTPLAETARAFGACNPDPGPFLTIIVGGGANAPPVPRGGTKISNNKNAYRQIC